MRIIHWRMLRLNTGKLPRSLRPSAVTSSLATTVPRPGHQLTGASRDVRQAVGVDDLAAFDRRQRRPRTPVGQPDGLPDANSLDQLGDRAGALLASLSYQELKICRKIHCVHR